MIRCRVNYKGSRWQGALPDRGSKKEVAARSVQEFSWMFLVAVNSKEQ